jgi:ribosomal protein S18 acetylase RimI-like enzyme
MTKCAYCSGNAAYRDRESGAYLCIHHARLEVVGPREEPPRPPLTIRPSTPADGTRIDELAAYFWNEIVVHCFGHSHQLDTLPAHVACDGDEIVGAASYALEKDAVNLAALLVLPQWQGHGVARELIAQVIETARAEGASRIIVATANDNPLALAFYQRLGFVITGILVGREMEIHGRVDVGFAGIPVRDEIQLEMRL